MVEGDKKIALNTFYIYVRLIITTVLGLITTRFALSALGQSDFGLYGVVGGVVSTLNVFGIALSTTTRRFLSVEKGLPNGNLNKVFNICMVVHIGLALVMFLLAESIGIFYIKYFLNVSSDRIIASNIVFQVSTIVSLIGLINVPYQSLIMANEQFKTISIIDIIYRFVQLLFVFFLQFYSRDRLILYAIIMCLSTLVSLFCYSFSCKKRWPAIVKWHIYNDKQYYKDVIVFNNYTALGAGSYIARSQGSNMIVNYFFGTLVNGAFSIASMLESYTLLIVSNLSSAASPQIAQNYSSGNVDRAFYLCSRINRYSVLFMMSIVFVLLVELNFFLELWLGIIPEGALVLCKLTLICAFVRSLTEGIPPFIQATGKIKWFQLFGSIIDLVVLPISCVLFILGHQVYDIVICYILYTLIYKILTLYLLYRLIHVDIHAFIKQSYLPSVSVFLCYVFFYLCFLNIKQAFAFHPIIIILISVLYCCVVVYIFGITSGERYSIVDYLKKNNAK